MTAPEGASFRRIGIVARSSHNDLVQVVERLVRFAGEHDLELLFEEQITESVPGVPTGDLRTEDCDLIIALGGDGTLLRAGRTGATREIPVLGINLGRLGFLTASPEPEMEHRLGMLLRGEYDLERRSVLEATVAQNGVDDHVRLAWNDVVLHKTGVARVTLLDLRVEAGGTWSELGSISGDGLIVSTPTGSTAYSLSAGGPIVSPTLDCMVLTPICPHTLAARPLVIPGDHTVSIRTLEDTAELVLTVDGQGAETFSSDDEVRLRISDVAVPVVQFPDQTFYSTIRQKLRWAARPDAKTP